MKFGLTQLAVLITATYLGNVNADMLKVKLGGDRLVKRGFNESYIDPISGAHIFTGYISLGSPEQKILVQFDTGSYTLAANYKGSDICQEGYTCSSYGSYDPATSPASVNTSIHYNALYSDGSYGEGHYFNDTFHIGGLTVDNYKFGVMEMSNSPVNLIGMSLIFGDKTAPIFNNFLYNNGLISRRVFSTHFSTSTKSGSVVIGGLDEAKYSGTLERIPVNDYNKYTVTLSGVSTDCEVVNTDGYSVLLDTGSDGNSVPDALYHQLHQAIGGKITKVPIESMTEGPDGAIEENYVLKCAYAKPLTLDFSGKKVSLAAENYLISLYDGSSPLFDSDGDALCTTTFFNGGSSDSATGYILGAHFLKDLFVVWDADNAEVALAESVTTDSEDLVEITGDIPNAVKARDYDDPNTATTDTSYASASTQSLSVTTILTSGLYTGAFSTAECTSSSSASSSVSRSVSYSASYSTTSVGTCMQCSGTSSSSRLSIATRGASSATSSTSSASSSSEPVSPLYKNVPDVSTFIERENSTAIKTFTSCSSNACSKGTLTSVFAIASFKDSTTENSSPPSSEALSTVAPEQPSDSSIPLSSVSIVLPSLGGTTVAVEASTTMIASTQEGPSTTLAPTIFTSLPAILPSSESSNTEEDSTTTVQTYVTVSQQTLTTPYNVSSVAISTYEGGSNNVVIPGFFKIISFLF